MYNTFYVVLLLTIYVNPCSPLSHKGIMDGLANCVNHVISMLEMLMAILVISTSGTRQVVPRFG